VDTGLHFQPWVSSINMTITCAFNFVPAITVSQSSIMSIY